MPVLTTASAISRISLSLTLHPNLFQLFQPIGGVAATVLDCASAVCGHAPPVSRQTIASTSKAGEACEKDFLTITSVTITPDLDAQIIQRVCAGSRLARLRRFSRPRFGQIVAIQALTDQSLDYRLAADVQFLCGFVQLFEHSCCEIDVDALNRLHHPAGVGEESRYVFTAFRQTRDRFGTRQAFCLTSSLHTNSF